MELERTKNGMDEAKELFCKNIYKELKARYSGVKIFVTITENDILVVDIKHYTYKNTRIGIHLKFEDATSYMLVSGSSGRIVAKCIFEYRRSILRAFEKDVA